jgi:hypothetical protein
MITRRIPQFTILLVVIGVMVYTTRTWTKYHIRPLVSRLRNASTLVWKLPATRVLRQPALWNLGNPSGIGTSMRGDEHGHGAGELASIWREPNLWRHGDKHLPRPEVGSPDFDDHPEIREPSCLSCSRRVSLIDVEARIPPSSLGLSLLGTCVGPHVGSAAAVFPAQKYSCTRA